MRPSVTFTLAIALAQIIGCSEKKQGPPHAKTVREALSRLLERPKGAFVIIEEPKSGKFVQLAGSREEELLLDLPSQTLSAEEMERAKEAFAKLGYPGPETYEVRAYPGGPPAGTQTSFQVKFGDNKGRAAELVVIILHEVYGFDKSKELKLTEE